MAKNKLYWEKEKKRESEKEEKRSRKKRKKKKRAKREEKERKEEKREKEKKKQNKQTKNKEGYPLVLYTVNLSTSPGAFQRCLVKHLLFPSPSSWSQGLAVLILKCVHLGELPRPLQGAGLSGSCLSVRPLLPGGLPFLSTG